MNYQYAFDSIRVKHGKESIAAFCRRCGISPTYMTQLRNGTSTPSVSLITKIAKANGVKAWEIFKLAEEADEP